MLAAAKEKAKATADAARAKADAAASAATGAVAAQAQPRVFIQWYDNVSSRPESRWKNASAISVPFQCHFR